MNGYVTLKIDKVKTIENIKLIDEEMTKLEPKDIITIAGKGKSFLNHFEETTKNVKVQQQSILAITCLITAKYNNKISIDEFKSWIKDSISCADNYFGMKNVKKIYVRHNKSIEHINLFIIPIKDNKLCANHFMLKLSNFKTLFYNTMNSYGLKEDIGGHKTISKEEKNLEDEKIIHYLDKNPHERKIMMNKINKS